jgi:hypothetical protein
VCVFALTYNYCCYSVYCPVGYEIKNENQCVPCERGFYKDNVGTAQFEGCKQCPQDTTDMMGATSSEDCKIRMYCSVYIFKKLLSRNLLTFIKK